MHQPRYPFPTEGAIVDPTRLPTLTGDPAFGCYAKGERVNHPVLLQSEKGDGSREPERYGCRTSHLGRYYCMWREKDGLCGDVGQDFIFIALILCRSVFIPIHITSIEFSSSFLLFNRGTLHCLVVLKLISHRPRPWKEPPASNRRLLHAYEPARVRAGAGTFPFHRARGCVPSQVCSGYRTNVTASTREARPTSDRERGMIR